MDAETKAVFSIQKKLEGLVGHEGWPIARQRLTDRILELQNAFDIDVTDAGKMLIDLESRKMASKILFDWLRDLEGTASMAKETAPKKPKGHILRDN